MITFLRKQLKKSALARNTYLLIARWYSNANEKLYNKPYKVKRAFILKIANKFNCKDTFIESGTFLGDTVEFVNSHFNTKYSIELSKELAEKATKRFETNKSVKIINGDSGLIINDLIQKINTPIFFWLDGHYSYSFYVGNQFIQTAKGDDFTPILRELKGIKDHIIKNHIILIDDARLFTGKNGYPKVKDLRQLFKNTSYKVTRTNKDIITILPQ